MSRKVRDTGVMSSKVAADPSSVADDMRYKSTSSSSDSQMYCTSDQMTDNTASSQSYLDDNHKQSDNGSNLGCGMKKPRYYGSNSYSWQGKQLNSDEITTIGKNDEQSYDNSSVFSLPIKNLKVSETSTNYYMPSDETQSEHRVSFGLPSQSQWRAFSDTSSSCSLPPYREYKSPSNEQLFPVRHRKCQELINCRVCGQFHKAGETHLYDYYQPVDDDVICRICRQPLVDPLDTKCGHTFCARCLQLYLRTESVCSVCGLQVVYKQCQQSSTIVHRLLDKLLVVCPNVDYCEEVLQRCDLDSHLRLHCRGAVTKCPHADDGCQFTGPRSALSSHLWECGFKTPSKGRKPILDGQISRIAVEQGDRDLGLSIVGGSDTPLTCIVIQEVLVDGAIADDGRLMQGDLILEINGDDLTQVTHYDAIKLLSKRCVTCHLMVYREKIAEPPPSHIDEVIKVKFSKTKTQQLGIKLVGRRSGQGVYVLSLVPGGQAVMDGQLRPDDRIIEINGHNLTHGTQEQAVFLIQLTVVEDVKIVNWERVRRVGCTTVKGRVTEISITLSEEAEGKEEEKSPDVVEMVVSRVTRPETPDLIRSISQYSNYNEVVDIKPAFSHMLSSGRCREKFITVKKAAKETLGLSIAGGVGSPRGDTPIYISNISASGCFGRDRQLSRGDLLLSVNGTSLYGLTHNDAVTVLKSQSDATSVSLRVLTCPETNELRSHTDHFSPSWFYWLQLPEVYESLTVVTLQRNNAGSLGFSIVGGTDSCHGSIPVYIKSVVIDTPASKDGRLRCGDMIVSVNNTSLQGITHDEAVTVLKKAPTTVTITVVSWPGSLV